MKQNSKNVKISQHHHEMLKKFCDRNHQKMYRVLEKIIEEYCRPKRKDIYGDEINKDK